MLCMRFFATGKNYVDSKKAIGKTTDANKLLSQPSHLLSAMILMSHATISIRTTRRA